MLREQLYEIWAPPGALWSPWVKPVMFLNLDAATQAPLPTTGEFVAATDASFAPAPGDAAIVLDQPGEEALRLGVALAHRGYRPVPLYNCCAGPKSVIDVTPIIRGLVVGGAALDQIKLAWNAPPVFLLDSRRRDAPAGAKPGMFDNRWLTLPQDFPSANLLLANGIRRVLLLQDRDGQPRDDLAHVLLRWQEAGMSIEGAPLGRRPEPIRVHRPSRFAVAAYALFATLGMRRNSAGGFGSVIPHPSSGGSG